MGQALDDVDWSSLGHAYGEASDVPHDIRMLNAEDETSRKDALSRLLGSIYHQGTRYTATVAAIPFLADAALERITEQTPDIIHVLSAIAEASVLLMIENDQTVAEFREAMRQADSDLSLEDRKELEALGYYPSVEIEVYDAVSEQVEKLWPLVAEHETNIKCAMVELLSNFPEHWEKTQSYIKELLETVPATEDYDSVRISCFHAISSASRLKEIDTHDDILEPFLTEENTVITRARAALALKNPSDQIFRMLLKCLDEADKLFSIDRGLKTGNGWTAARISRLLAEHAQFDPSEVLPKLIGALKAASSANADTCPIVHAIIMLLAGGDQTQNYFADKQRHDLNDNERKALLAIADDPIWTLENRWYGNFIKTYGLPDRPDQLRQYVLGPLGLLKTMF